MLAFVANLNGFSVLTFASGTKDIFRLALYLVLLINGLLPKLRIENRFDEKHMAFQKTYGSFYLP